MGATVRSQQVDLSSSSQHKPQQLSSALYFQSVLISKAFYQIYIKNKKISLELDAEVNVSV